MTATEINTDQEGTKPGLIYKAIQMAIGKCESIGKDRKNLQQNYQFRGIDDFYDMLHPIFAEVGIFSTSRLIEKTHTERQTKNGGTMHHTVVVMRYRFFATDGSYVDTDVIGEGADSGDKSCNKAMATAHKYAFTQLFAVATDEKDKDTEESSPEFSSKKATLPAKAQAKPQPSNAQRKPLPRIISEPQRKRLYTIATELGWKDDEVKEVLKKYNFTSSKEITVDVYDKIVKEIQK